HPGICILPICWRGVETVLFRARSSSERNTGENAMPSSPRPCMMLVFAALLCVAASAACAEEDFASWPLLQPVFPSTGGGGIMIGGYDPIIIGEKCVTDFMATEPSGKIYYNSVEFDAVPAQGGTLCTNGRWRARDGSASGTTPFRVFIKDGVRRGS